MALTEYKNKRHFDQTPEPAAKLARSKGWSYVIQKHAASHLHYDFRLELDGVLKSWAVPKGPSLDPSVKRLAMHVEDHPVEYGGFEGIIPQGEYGGGTVLLWDSGHWEPVGDPREGYQHGKLKFVLHGKKLRGGWTLVKTHHKEPGRDNQWLLIKEQDDEAKAEVAEDVLMKLPLSVVSGRNMDEIAASPDCVWGSKSKSTEPKSKISKSKLKLSSSTDTAIETGTGTDISTSKADVAKPAGKKGASGSDGLSKSKKSTSSSAAAAVPTKTRKALGKSPATAVAKKNAMEKINLDYDSTNETFSGVRLTHPQKILYPDKGITKLEIAAYYRDISEWMLPHILHRPLVLFRSPDGQDKEGFYQKHPGIGTPELLRKIPIQESNKTENYVVIDNVEGLIALAQISALEIHAWGSKEDKLERPDRLVFDLDPSPEVPWKQVVEGARHIRQFLLDLGLQSFVKTTGGKGLHLVVPIERRHDWDEAKSFCKAVADGVVTAAPSQYTANMSKAVRPNKIFLDYLRNGRGATAVAPFSLRSRPGAPVSMPLTWDELTPELHSDHFTIQNSLERMAGLAQDPWEGLNAVKQTLTTPIKTLKKLGLLH